MKLRIILLLVITALTTLLSAPKSYADTYCSDLNTGYGKATYTLSDVLSGNLTLWLRIKSSDGNPSINYNLGGGGSSCDKTISASSATSWRWISATESFVTSGGTTQSLVAAKIIGFQGNGKIPSQFIINAGKKEGLKEGMSVIFGKYLVGKIVTVGQNYSVVTTPFSEKFKVLAKLPETNANGIILGRSDLLLFDGVVITDTLKKDGIIVTKGEVDSSGIGVVPDLIIGKITSISKNETSPFQSAEVMPVIEYPKLIDVFVISQM